MSSILRALKKLEKDPRQAEDSPPLESTFIPLADGASQKAPPGILMMVIGGGVICGLVILAGWWLFSEKHQFSPVAPEKTPLQVVQQPGLLPTPAPEPGSAQKSEDSSVTSADLAADRAAQQETVEQIPVPEADALPQAVVQETERKAEQEDIENVEEPAPADEAAETPGAIEAQPPETATGVPPAPTKAAEIKIPLLDDPDMNLQAITWSKEPQKRLAIINSRILRQGETVDGYILDTINPDDIILSQQGKKWKLLFRIK